MVRPALRLIESDIQEISRGPLGRLSDAQLVALAKEGDKSAIEGLYCKYAGYALNLAVRLQGNQRDVEDIVHDAFLRGVQRLGELRDPSAFRSWLGAIVVREVRGRLRRGRLLSRLGLSNENAVELDSLASDVAGPETRAQLAQVYALLRLMPADQRIAWTLRHVQRHRLEEVAALTDCSLATVKRRIQRAQQFFEAHYVSSGEDSSGENSSNQTRAEPGKSSHSGGNR